MVVLLSLSAVAVPLALIIGLAVLMAAGGVAIVAGLDNLGDEWYRYPFTSYIPCH